MVSKRYAIANNEYMKDYDPLNHPNLSHILMQIIFTVGQCQENFQQEDLNG